MWENNINLYEDTRQIWVVNLQTQTIRRLWMHPFSNWEISQHKLKVSNNSTVFIHELLSSHNLTDGILKYIDGIDMIYMTEEILHL